MNKQIDVLDHGSVRLVEFWGSDRLIIESARVSTQKGFEGWGPKCRTCGDAFDGPERECPSPSGKPYYDAGRGGHVFDAPGDEKLLGYLWRNNHSTPFEMAGAILEIQAPIFVFREWHRHRTQSYSEASARYAPLPDVNYIPSVERLMRNGGVSKQAGSVAGAAELTVEAAEEYRATLALAYEADEALYQNALSAGVPKELARVHLPVGRYSRMRASANLRNWLAFLTLREASNAQWEIQEYARAVHVLLRPVFPRTIALFEGSK